MLIDRDHDMIHLASRRGPVIVDIAGRPHPAILIAWRPKRNGRRSKRARIELAGGRLRTVPCTAVTLEASDD
jgi:hypothetical protein